MNGGLKNHPASMIYQIDNYPDIKFFVIVFFRWITYDLHKLYLSLLYVWSTKSSKTWKCDVSLCLNYFVCSFYYDTCLPQSAFDIFRKYLYIKLHIFPISGEVCSKKFCYSHLTKVIFYNIPEIFFKFSKANKRKNIILYVISRNWTGLIK